MRSTLASFLRGEARLQNSSDKRQNGSEQEYRRLLGHSAHGGRDSRGKVYLVVPASPPKSLEVRQTDTTCTAHPVYETGKVLPPPALPASPNPPARLPTISRLDNQN